MFLVYRGTRRKTDNPLSARRTPATLMKGKETQSLKVKNTSSLSRTGLICAPLSPRNPCSTWTRGIEVISEIEEAFLGQLRQIIIEGPFPSSSSGRLENKPGFDSPAEQRHATADPSALSPSLTHTHSSLLYEIACFKDDLSKEG